MDTDIRLYPRDSTNMTLSIYWSREIATLPRPNTLLLPLSANVIVFFDEGLRNDSMRRFLSPVMWLVHPLSMIHSVFPDDFCKAPDAVLTLVSRLRVRPELVAHKRPPMHDT